MPLPRTVAVLNKRFTNRFIEPVVRQFSGFAVVEHTGRRSGATYCTPVTAFDHNGALLVALTYGPKADWVLNVLASGGTLARSGTTQTISATTVVGRQIAWAALPPIVRGFLRILRVRHFLLIEVSD